MKYITAVFKYLAAKGLYGCHIDSGPWQLKKQV